MPPEVHRHEEGVVAAAGHQPRIRPNPVDYFQVTAASKGANERPATPRRQVPPAGTLWPPPVGSLSSPRSLPGPVLAARHNSADLRLLAAVLFCLAEQQGGEISSAARFASKQTVEMYIRNQLEEFPGKRFLGEGEPGI